MMARHENQCEPEAGRSKFGAIGCCAMDVAVLSNYTGSSQWQETPHESNRACAEDSCGSATACARQWRASAPNPWVRQGTKAPSKPGRAEGRRLPASRSISGSGSGDRIAAVDARWQIGQGRHRGVVGGRKTATKRTSFTECQSLGLFRAQRRQRLGKNPLVLTHVPPHGSSPRAASTIRSLHQRNCAQSTNMRLPNCAPRSSASLRARTCFSAPRLLPLRARTHGHRGACRLALELWFRRAAGHL